MSSDADSTDSDVRALRRKVHQTIKRVTDGLENFGFNTTVAALMELKNTMIAARKTSVVNSPAWDEAIRTLLLMMAPITPHIAEELWAHIGGAYSIHTQAWPIYDADAAKADTITLIVQINGKIRDRIDAPADISEDDAKARALHSAAIIEHLKGGEPKKVVYVAGRGMINIVV